MNAEDVKAALRRRHPATITRNGFTSLGAWTVLEEFLSIDLLAISALESPSSGARTEKVPDASTYRTTEERRTIARYPIVGYEVKVSRSDYRRELLRPDKRGTGRLRCHEFYFATPKGLLKPEEVAFVEPPALSFGWAYERTRCPGPEGAPRARASELDVPIDEVGEPFTSRCYRGKVTVPPDYAEETCPRCEGRGYLARSLAEELAPTLWVPADVGLVEVSGGRARIVRPSPVIREPQPLRELGALVRYVSLRPDPRHAAVRESDERLAELRRRAA